MKELSLNILDVAGNSIKAKATLVTIRITEEGRTLTIQISDNGCGMSPEMVATVTDPFTTTRTTRKVGLGLPFFKLAAEQTGGYLQVESRWEKTHPVDHGTVVTALFYRDHVDLAPLGDVVSTLTTLIQGSPEIDFVFTHRFAGNQVSLDTRQMREILGSEVSLSTPDVIQWITDSLREEYGSHGNK